MLRFASQLTAKPPLNLLPVDLLLVRNGTCEGTIALKKTKMGDPRFLNTNLIQTHNSKWRLTEFGKIQARASGRWIKSHFPNGFDAYMTGEYVRSLETAACLDLKEAKWVPSLYLRPRDFGAFSDLNNPLTKKEYEEHMKERARDIFYWTPPNGESIAHLTLRTERVIHWMRHHVPSDGAAIIVTHKDVMETIRIRIEKISQLDYADLVVNAPQNKQLNYCSILHYTRRNPKTGEIIPNYKWMRVTTPWMGKHFTDVPFTEINRKIYGNEELLAEVSNVPRLFDVA